MLRLSSGLPIALGLVVSTVGSALAGPPPPKKVSPDAAAAPASSTLPVIIQYKQAQTSAESTLLTAVGGTAKGNLNSIKAVTANVPQSALNQLAADSNVAYISIDRPVSARQAVTVTGANYTVEPIDAPAVWTKGYVGSNIGVAVIDSGITPVADLNVVPTILLPGKQPLPLIFLPVPGEVAPGNNGRIVYSQNFSTDEKDAKDYFGHGTHVAGLIAGNGAQSTGKNNFRTFYGAAPNANLINLRVLDSTGASTDSIVIAAIEQAIALKNTYNIRVINLSLGRPIFESYTQDPLCQAVEQAWKAGIVVVVAAGNDGRDLNLNAEGYGTINAPGNDPYVITVGAMNTNYTATLADDIIASYSSKGPSFIDDVSKPDIVAPGNLVSSLQFGGDPLPKNNPTFITEKRWYESSNDSSPSPDYFPLSGTSMATGVTSGAIADLLQANPSLTPDEVKALVMVNADRSYFPQTSSVVAGGVTYNANYDVFTIGAGYLDINATVTDALVNGGSVPAGTAMSPIATYNATTGTTTLVTDQTALWGRTTPFSASSVYGTSAFVSTGSAALFGSSALSDASDPNGYSALFGSTALWGRSTPAAATALWGRDDTEAASAVPLAQ